MGYSEEGRQRLHPEEALYLLECVSGVLEAWGKGSRLMEWEGYGLVDQEEFRIMFSVKLCADFENRRGYHWTAGVLILSLFVLVMH